jgi:aryl-alcohol dehydrogenase-like predicted oxidoreductase
MSKILNNKLILGTVQMGLPYGINNTTGKISLVDSIGILEYAYNNGIGILDTAEAYGNAHKVIGVFHAKNPTKIFRVITKLPNQINEDIVEKVGSYLVELNVKQLDTLLFHSFTSYQNNIENFDVLVKLKSDGKINHLGVSVYTNKEIEMVMLNEDIDIIQLPFNLFDNINLRKTVLEKAKSKGKIIHTRSALLQGLFFKDPNDSKNTVQKLKNELRLLNTLSEENSASISQLALSYCLQQENIDNVLIGVDSIRQLKENVKAVNYKIEPKTVDSINTIKVQDLDLLNPSLWK